MACERTRKGNRQRCPFCAHRRLSVTNSLAALHPELAAEWHVEKNGVLHPKDVVPGSRARAWWQCPAGRDHVWQTKVSERACVGTGCPFCAGHRASKATALSVVAPRIAKEWHPTKNGVLGPDDIVATSQRVVAWRCAKVPKHVWSARVSTRTKGSGACPLCVRGYVPSRTQRPELRGEMLSTAAPELLRSWHPTKNLPLRPKDVAVVSSQLAWWRCARGRDHVWRAQVRDRVRGIGCPFCAGQRVSVTNSLASLAPKAAREWHPTKNAPVTPRDVGAGSAKKYWWRCRKGHEWETQVRSRALLGTACPTCVRETRAKGGGFGPKRRRRRAPSHAAKSR